MNETPAAGRFLYFVTLQRLRPEFWRDLNKIWRTGDALAFRAWVEQYAASDQWILETVLFTLQMWSADPDGSAAKLDVNVCWFECDFQIPFRPSVDQNPRPCESIAAYRTRIDEQFNEQFCAWSARRLGDMSGFDDWRQRQACTWLVRHQAGETYRMLGDELYLSNDNYEDPAQAVRRAVIRFAESIGLALRGTKSFPFCTVRLRENVA